MASALVTRPAGGALQFLGSAEAFRPLWIGMLIAVVAGTVHYLVSSMRRDGHELEHLRAMHEAYRSERESTGS